VHFDIYKVHAPTDALFIKLDNVLKFILKITFDLLLHVSVYDHHQGAFARARLKLYLGKDLVKTTSLYVMRWCGSMLPHDFTPGKEPVPILQEAEWAPGPVWTGGKSRTHRDSISDRPARSQSGRSCVMSNMPCMTEEAVFAIFVNS